MENLFRYFIKNNRLTYLITLAVLFAGYFAYSTMNLDLMPKVDFGQTYISAIYPGASPEDVERQVTNKIEEKLKTVSGIKKTTSNSMQNRSFVQIWIDPDVKDQKLVQEEIRAAVDRINDFPPEMTERPKVSALDSSIFPIVEIGLSGNYSYKELWERAFKFENKLKNTQGVSHLQSYGYEAKEILIEVNSKKLDHYEIGLGQIYQSIQTRNQSSSSGSTLSHLDKKNIVTKSQFRDPFEVGDVIIKSSFEGLKIKVKDLAVITEGFEKPLSLSRTNGKESINFIVFKTDYADITQTVEKIKELSNQFKKENPGLNISFINDTSKVVNNRFSVLTSNGIQGLVLIWIVLTIFLSFNTSLFVSLGIPVSMAGVLVVLKLYGLSLDAISLSGMIIVLGLMVDDAVIISENIHRHHEEFKKNPIDAAVDGLKEIVAPVMATVFVTVMAFAPMFFMKGLMGKFIFVIPLVVLVSMVVGLFEGIFLLPAHLVHGLEKGEGFESKRKKWFYIFKNKFHQSLSWVLARRKKVIVIYFLLLFGTILFTIKFVDFILFPGSTADRVFVHIQVPPGSSLEANRDKTAQMEKFIDQLPKEEGINYVTRIGMYTTQHAGPKPSENLSTIEMDLLPYGKRKKTPMEIVDLLKEKSKSLKGFDSITFEMIEGGPPMGSPVAIKIIGKDEVERKKMADEVFNYLKTIPGVKSPDRDDKVGKSEIRVELNHPKLSLVGLDVPSVTNTLRMAYDGLEVTEGRFGPHDISFRMVLDQETRSNEKMIGNIKVLNNMGKLIPLREVADFKGDKESMGEIRHYNGEPAISISSDVDKSITTPMVVTNKVLEKFKNNSKFTSSRIVIGGEAEETMESLESLGITFLISIICIYFILVHLFDSFIQPLYVLLAVTFGIIGVCISFFFHGEPLGFMALLGVVGLSGIVVNDAIVLVDFVNNLRKSKLDKPIEEIVAAGTADRLRQGLVTTVSAIVGVLPMAYGIGGADIFMVPMALAMGYGLIFAVTMNLYVLPCVYLEGEEFFRRIFSWRKKKTGSRMALPDQQEQAT